VTFEDNEELRLVVPTMTSGDREVAAGWTGKTCLLTVSLSEERQTDM